MDCYKIVKKKERRRRRKRRRRLGGQRTCHSFHRNMRARVWVLSTRANDRQAMETTCNPEAWETETASPEQAG